MKLAVLNTQAQFKVVSLPLPLLLKVSRNHQETEGNSKTLSTVEISLLMRLSVLPDRYETNL